jgi:HEAT repeat protein
MSDNARGSKYSIKAETVPIVEHTDGIEIVQGFLETDDATVPGKVSNLLENLTNPDPACRAEAAQTLGEIGDENAIPALAKVVSDDPNPEVRGSAIRALGKLGSTQSSS